MKSIKRGDMMDRPTVEPSTVTRHLSLKLQIVLKEKAVAGKCGEGDLARELLATPVETDNLKHSETLSFVKRTVLSPRCNVEAAEQREEYVCCKP
jgi:hypothetical protein